MNCPSCGHENRPEARFCGECAQSLASEQTCSECGAQNLAGQKFCDSCAHPLQAAAPAAAPPPRDRRAYTPKHLVDKILQSKSALEGERKQLTVLFADVRRSMELSEQVDPEQWHAILDRFFQILADGVHRFEGTVNQFTGDGIMALFGAPIAHEDHAQRACYAALHLRDELRRYANEVRVAHGLSFAVRMGINSGEVIVGKIGDDLRMDYTAQGHTVGLAARMQEIAEPGTPYLAESTAALARGYFELEDMGEMQIKGSAAAVQVFALSGVGAMRTRLDVSRARGFSKFVGRANEMQALETALERALEGQGQVVGVVAEAGMGKSRLCFEFAEHCRANDIVVRTTTGMAHGKAVPFLPILEYYRSAFGIEPDDEPTLARQKVAGALVLLDEELRDSLPLLLEFLGIGDPANPAPHIDPEERQRSLVGLLQRLTMARSERQASVMLFEDLHWFDTGSEALLEALIDALAGTRTLLVTNYRPEYRGGDWMHRSYVQQLALQPLDAESLQLLLTDLLGASPSVADLRETILARTGGNPFFIEEVVQALAEQGALAGTRADYRLVRPLDDLQIPASVSNVLAARIDRLSDGQKTLLQAASVIGTDFSESLLARVAGQSPDALAAGLAALVQSEFLWERALYPEREYTFKHALTRDVAYDSQLAARRAVTHAAVAEALEQVHADNLDEKAALLATHWEQAGSALPAARWHRRAAEWVGMGNAREYRDHWTRVRELSAGLDPSSESDELALQARLALLLVAGRVGTPPDEAQAIYDEAEVLVERSGDEALRARLLNAYSMYRGVSMARAPSSMWPELERTREIADASGDPAAQVTIRYTMGANFVVTGRADDAIRVADEALAILELDPTIASTELGFPAVPAMLYMKASGLMNNERHLDAASIIEDIRRLAHESNHPAALWFAGNAACIHALLVGDVQRGLASAAEALEIAERAGNRGFRIMSSTFLLRAHVFNGDPDEAVRVGEEALEFNREQSIVFAEVMLLATLAWAYAEQGDLASAKTTAVNLLEQLPERGEWFPLPEVLCRIALARGLADDDRSVAETQLDLAAERAAGGRVAEALVLEGRAALAAGAEATEHLRAAQRLYVDAGAAGHADRLARALGH